MHEFSLLEIIPVNNLLGECILWDDHTQQIWWTDIHRSRLYCYRPGSGQPQQYILPGRLCSFGFVAGDSRLICAFAEGFALYQPATGEREWLFQPESACQGTRFNDGRVDQQGRFWAGTMVESEPALDALGQPLLGSLYWVSSQGMGKAFGNIGISNSLCWSNDGRRMYFADSKTATIQVFDFDAATATAGNTALFATTPAGSSPDGSIVDAEDCLWNAQWGGGKIRRYAPDGTVLTELQLPVSQPTCQCFGGPELDLLIISSACENLDARQLDAQPQAGNVFIYRTPYKGVPENRYRL